MKKSELHTLVILAAPISAIFVVGLGVGHLRDALASFSSPVGVSGSDFCYPESDDLTVISGNIGIYSSWSALTWWREGANVKAVKFVAITDDGKRHKLKERVGYEYYRPDSNTYILYTAMATVSDLKAAEKIVRMETTIHVQGAGNLTFTTPITIGSCNQ